MKVTISTYWKCQLIGWGSYSLYLYVANIIINPGNSVLRRAIITWLFGMVATHVLRWIIKRLKIFDKTYAKQVIYLVLLNVIIQFFAAVLMLWVLRVAAILTKDHLPDFSLSRFIRNAVSLYYEWLILTTAWTAVYFFVQYTRKIKKAENEKADLKIKLIESEARLYVHK